MNPPVIQTTYNFIPEIYNSTFKTGVFTNGLREGFIAFLSKMSLSDKKTINHAPSCANLPISDSWAYK